MIDYYEIREKLYESFSKLVDSDLISFDMNYNIPLDHGILTEHDLLNMDKTLMQCYSDIANGFYYKWTAIHDSNITGQMEFLKMKQVLRDWKDNLYYEEDVEQNDLIQYYKPFDLISETFSCGFLLTPDFVSKTIYCHNAPYPETYSLDVDFSGYMIMAKEALIFQYWPQVLLDIQSGEESTETILFKEHMSKLKDDFSWDAFVEKYQSLRLSNQP